MSEVRKLEKGYRGRLSPAVIRWMEERSVAFGDATSSARGKPRDGVTYGSGKVPKETSRGGTS